MVLVRVGWIGGFALGGCGDSLLGAREIDQRIGSPPLPAQATWEVRWVMDEGLEIDCERPPVEVPDGPAVLGQLQVAPPVAPTPRFVERPAYRYALVLWAVTQEGAPYPEPGEGALESDFGVWGTTAPVGFLVVEGDAIAAGQDLMRGGDPARTGWIDVLTEEVVSLGGVEGAMEPLDVDAFENGVTITSLAWSDDEDLDVWSGDIIGGIRASCADP